MFSLRSHQIKIHFSSRLCNSLQHISNWDFMQHVNNLNCVLYIGKIIIKDKNVALFFFSPHTSFSLFKQLALNNCEAEHVWDDFGSINWCINLFYYTTYSYVTFLRITTKRGEQIALSVTVLPFLGIYSPIKHYIDH